MASDYYNSLWGNTDLNVFLVCGAVMVGGPLHTCHVDTVIQCIFVFFFYVNY